MRSWWKKRSLKSESAKMNKINIGMIVSALTLASLFSGLVLKFGNLPQAVAKQEERLEKVEAELSKADKNFATQAVELDYLKKNTNLILEELRNLRLSSEDSRLTRTDSR